MLGFCLWPQQITHSNAAVDDMPAANSPRRNQMLRFLLWPQQLTVLKWRLFNVYIFIRRNHSNSVSLYHKQTHARTQRFIFSILQTSNFYCSCSSSNFICSSSNFKLQTSSNFKLQTTVHRMFLFIIKLHYQTSNFEFS